jgi:hypothetical protein
VRVEVRLIVYKVKGVKPDSYIDPLIDMYVKASIGGSPCQSTDTHLRAENGTGSFNWRMKFDVELPPAREGAAQLVLQVGASSKAMG